MKSLDKSLADTLKFLCDTSLPAQYVWIGISTTGLKDRAGDFIPARLTRNDIITTAREIKRHAIRPFALLYDHVTKEYYPEQAINGTHYEDFGALLFSHNPSRLIGRRAMRVSILEQFACLECGWTYEKSAPATMSIGYRYWLDENSSGSSYPLPYAAVCSHEVSRTIPGTEANAYTFFAASPSDMRRDILQQALMDEFSAYLADQ